MEELKYRLDMMKEPIWRFVSASPFAKDNLLYIQESGKFLCGKKYFTIRKNLNSYLIKFTLSGKGILEYCGEKYVLSPGSLMFIDCKKPQKYYTDPSCGKWEMIWVHFNGGNTETYYEKFTEKTGGKPAVMLSDDNAVNEIIESITEISASYAKNPDSEIIADALLHSLLKECIVKCDQSVRFPGYVNEIAGYLRHHCKEKIDLDMLSEEFCVSKFHLQRTFKATMGKSPAKYLSDVRMSKAKKLLRSTDMTVNEIAEQIGMEPGYFIQLFKACENETPKEYRNRWGQLT